jgi:glycosyltransferase involved in cell wall biosynthesis
MTSSGQGNTSASISVVIPAYNCESFVCRAIESALAQTVQPREIVVVDDGSADETFEVVSRYPAPVRAVRKPNGGPASARNLGVLQTTGEWIGFLDADDVWFPQKLERQVKFIRDDVAVVCSRARGAPPRMPARITFESLWRRNCIVNSSALVRRQAFISAGGLDQDRSIIGVEDYNLWLRLLGAGWNIVCVDEELCLRNVRPGSLARQAAALSWAGLANARKVAAQLRLPPELLREKELALYYECGLDCLSGRDMRNARIFFPARLRRKFEFRPLALLALTYAPVGLLNWRRALSSR